MLKPNCNIENVSTVLTGQITAVRLQDKNSVSWLNLKSDAETLQICVGG